jgi:formamidopyrimidine-DNA glycosylase
MPEGPEVLYIKNNLLDKFIGKKLESVKIKSGRYVNHGPPNNFRKFTKLLPSKCTNTYKKGKVIFIEFDNGYTIISKLGMTGWWFSNLKDFGEPEWRDANSKNVIFNFAFSKELIFSDFRNFGTLTFTNDQDIILDELDKLAPDITNGAKFNLKMRNSIINLTNKKPNELIEDIIIDQKKIFSGIGNYLKSEILYLCKISPLRPLKSIDIDTWYIIFKFSKKIVKKMYKKLVDGTLDDYINAMNVYQKKEDPYGNKIKTRTSKFGRTTFYVPSIQL